MKLKLVIQKKQINNSSLKHPKMVNAQSKNKHVMLFGFSKLLLGGSVCVPGHLAMC